MSIGVYVCLYLCMNVCLSVKLYVIARLHVHDARTYIGAFVGLRLGRTEGRVGRDGWRYGSWSVVSRARAGSTDRQVCMLS